MTSAPSDDTKLNLLLVEDSPEDAELEERELRRGGLDHTSVRVWTRSDLMAALSHFVPDCVVCDYSLPDMNGLDALKLVRSRFRDTPFIFVSGTIGEERAVEALKAGATDYVIKDRLHSLVPKVRRAIRDARDREYHARLEAHLRQSQKMEAIGRLTAGITHDFNNLLTVMNGYAQLVHDGLADRPSLREHAGEILKAGARASNLTRQLLAFTRQRPAALVSVDVAHVIRDMETMLRSLVRADVTLDLKMPAAPAVITGDAAHIEQIVMNLVVNARDATPKGGRIAITVESLDVKAGRLTTKRAGPHVRIEVADTGHGMPPETVARMFEPFFTTKPPGGGTGLGLSIVYGLVTQAGGAIEVDSAPNAGTRIAIFLPRIHAQEPMRPAISDHPTPPPHRDAVVLIVETDPALRKLLGMWLADFGYRVLVASNGEDALDIAASADRIDAIVVDLVLPRLAGRDVASRIAMHFPKLRTLFTSGGAAPEGDSSPFLARPFSPSQLVKKVQELLTRGDPE